MLIGVVGDRNPANETHTMLDASLTHAGAEGELATVTAARERGIPLVAT